jgi:uncharacterized membrane protein
MIDTINFMTFQIHGGGSGGGLAGALLSFFDFIDELLSKKPPEMFDFLFPGIARLDNVHPLFVHYPIAFFTVFLLVEVAGLALKKPQWRYVAGWLLYLGTISSALAVAAGLIAANFVEHNDAVHAIMEKHEHYGISVLSMGLLLSAWRMLGWGLHSMFANCLFLLLSAILCLVLSFGADLGGLMVYSYGVAVKPSADALVIIKPSVSEGSETLDKESEPMHGGHSHEHTGGHSHGGHDHDGHHHDHH